MIAFLAAAILASQPAAAKPALARCRSALAREAGGEIGTINVERSRVRRGWTTIDGRLTAFVGMGPPASGSASAHHLVRANYRYSCSVRGIHVRHVKLYQ